MKFMLQTWWLENCNWDHDIFAIQSSQNLLKTPEYSRKLNIWISIDYNKTSSWTTSGDPLQIENEGI